MSQMDDWVAGTPSSPGRKTMPVRSWRISSTEDCATPNLHRQCNLIGAAQEQPWPQQQLQARGPDYRQLCARPSQMAEARFAHVQEPWWGCKKGSGKSAEIRFMADQQASPLELREQGVMIATWLEKR